jgi:transposase
MGADRIELITRVERRRRWSVEEKLRLVAETYEDGKSVSIVAKARGVSPSLLYTWRHRALRGELTAPIHETAPAFMPITVIDDDNASPTTAAERSGLIEIDLGDGRRIRVDRDVDASALCRVLGVLGRR